MFSIFAGCCCGGFGQSRVSEGGGLSKKTGVPVKMLDKILIKDAGLVVIFAILATLGFSGVLPLAAGITFCVLAVVQLALTACMKTCTTVMKQDDPLIG